MIINLKFQGIFLPPAFPDVFPFFGLGQLADPVSRIKHDAIQHAAALIFPFGVAFGCQGNQLVSDFNRFLDVLITGFQCFKIQLEFGFSIEQFNLRAKFHKNRKKF